MRNFIVKFISKDDKVTPVIHKIRMPDYEDKGFYRIIGSWNWFTSGKKKGLTKEDRRTNRVNPCWAPTGLYYTHDCHEEEWLEKVRRQKEWLSHRDMTEEHRVELMKSMDETQFPVIEHASLYDFYEYIGFDRKARKYGTV